MKVIDIFPFFKEFDILDIRLNELDSVVDTFVLVESPYTHTKIKKPLYFKEYTGNRFDKFKDKIKHIEVSPIGMNNIPRTDDHWIERYNRDFAIKSLRASKFINGEDLVILADVDEIPKNSFVKSCKDVNLDYILNIKMKMFKYYLNLYFQEWKVCSIFKWKNFNRFNYNWDDLRRKYQYKVRVTKANQGWHFSSVGSAEEILQKFKSMSGFYNLSKRGLVDLNKIQDLIKHRVHSKYTGPVKGRFLSLNSMPQYVIDNADKFSHILGKDKIRS